MSKPITHTVIILDQSGSMSGMRKAAVANYNEQVQQAKLNAVDQEIYCSLLTFNRNVFEHLWNVPADKLVESTDEDYTCMGDTALYDAVGFAIDKLLGSTDKDNKNVSYLIQVVTDGCENASSHVNKDSLRNRITACQATGRWTFTFMGCSTDYLKKLSEETAVPVANMAAWAPQNADNGLRLCSANAGEFYRSRAAGQSATQQYSWLNEATGGALVDAPIGAADYAGTTTADLATAGVLSVNAAQPTATANCFANHQPVDWNTLNSTNT